MTFTIGLDCDGVCYAWEKTARYMLRGLLRSQGRDIPHELTVPSTHWDSVPESVTAEDWKWMWSEGVRNGLFRYGHCYPGAIEGAQALTELGDVMLITSRPKQAVHDTAAWIGFQFDKVPLAGIHILSHSEPKSQVSPAPNLFIDDAVHNLDDLLPNTKDHVRVILFDQPWNQGYEHELSHKWKRASGWPEAVELAAAAKAQEW